jgi:hypothetical protein
MFVGGIMKRVFHLDDIREASILINKQFDMKTIPIALRGIVVSLDGIVDMSYVINDNLWKNLHIDFKIKSIRSILKNGTELDGLCTRVDDKHAFVYASDRRKVDYFAERAEAPKSLKDKLAPALIVYDASLLTKPENPGNVFNVLLPEDAKLRSRAILAMYVNHTKESPDRNDLAF